MNIRNIENICIVGSSFMGSQIGLHCASHGYNVKIVDLHEELLEQALQNNIRELKSRVSKGQITSDEMNAILHRISFTEDLEKGTSAADLVIECVPERLDLKREIFAKLDKMCPKHTILATNSSSIRISAIEDATHRLDKVLNIHFYPPVWQRSMVELMRGTKTSDETIKSVRQFAFKIEVTPLRVLKESTGFIFNRVWRTMKKETLHLVNDGIASHEDVDRAWMISTGMSMGPLALMDMVGLDVVRDVEMVYYRESGDEKDAPPELLLRKIEKNELGVKTGKGFYTYPNPVFQDPSWLKGALNEDL